jgi:NitT/TauT family transport system ATP-binding protein
MKLRAARISKTFNINGTETVIFDAFSACVQNGEVLSVLGPSGCGKTTLLRILAGLAPPDAGDYVLQIDAKPVRGPDTRVSVIFQNYALFPWRTVSQNIAFGLELSGRSSNEVDARVDLMIEMVGLGGHRDRYPQSLSGGQQQRVAIARAFATEPEILLLDEPFSALDNERKDELRCEFLRWVRTLGLTAVVVTHDIREAVLLGDQIVVLGGTPARPKLSLHRELLSAFRLELRDLLGTRCSGEAFEKLSGSAEFQRWYSEVRQALQSSPVLPTPKS